MFSRAQLQKKSQGPGPTFEGKPAHHYFSSKRPPDTLPQSPYSIAGVRTFAQGESEHASVARVIRQPLPFPIQAKLMVGAANDHLEHEADRIADQMMKIPQPGMAGTSEAESIARVIVAGKPYPVPSQPSMLPIQAKGKHGSPCHSDGKIAKEDEHHEKPVQAKLKSGHGRTNELLSSRIDARRGGGEVLPYAVRRSIEPKLGVALGGVHVHRDAEAGVLAQSIGALAFTTRQDIYFAPGQYAPDTPGGTRLLLHELVHVVQQQNGDEAIRRFTLTDFNPGQARQMRAAIHTADSKMGACMGKGIPMHDIYDIRDGLKKADYVFKPEQDECGHSNPFTDTIKIGPNAFSHAACCDLESTLAHECAHSFAWGFEGFAQKVECKCFGCSC